MPDLVCDHSPAVKLSFDMLRIVNCCIAYRQAGSYSIRIFTKKSDTKPDFFCEYTLFTDLQTDPLDYWNKIYYSLKPYISIDRWGGAYSLKEPLRIIIFTYPPSPILHPKKLEPPFSSIDTHKLFFSFLWFFTKGKF